MSTDDAHIAALQALEGFNEVRYCGLWRQQEKKAFSLFFAFTFYVLFSAFYLSFSHTCTHTHTRTHAHTHTRTHIRALL